MANGLLLRSTATRSQMNKENWYICSCDAGKWLNMKIVIQLITLLIVSRPLHRHRMIIATLT
jgi:hypothetical protein